MNEKLFFNHFEQQDFSQSLSVFNQLDIKQQEAILQQLYYKAREANTPVAVSVLYRRLHDGKTFDDFYKAWLPPAEYANPINIGDKVYYQYANVPLRVINAVNSEDPKEVVSIGMAWCSEEQFAQLSEQIAKHKSNDERHNQIANVADKISAKTYLVKADTNLGN